MNGKVIDGPVDGFPFLQLPDVLDHQVRIKRIGMIVVEFGPLLIIQRGMLLVVKIMAQDGDLFHKLVADLVDHGTLAASCAAGDADYDYITHILLSLPLIVLQRF